jgi:hypothetical protein
MFATDVNNSSVFLLVWLFSCVVLCISERSVSIINNGGIELTCESMGELCVRKTHRETSFVFRQKRYTMGLDALERIQRKKDAFEERSSPLDRRSHCLLSSLTSGSQSNLRENIAHYFVPRGQKNKPHFALSCTEM